MFPKDQIIRFWEATGTKTDTFTQRPTQATTQTPGSGRLVLPIHPCPWLSDRPTQSRTYHPESRDPPCPRADTTRKGGGVPRYTLPRGCPQTCPFEISPGKEHLQRDFPAQDNTPIPPTGSAWEAARPRQTWEFTKTPLLGDTECSLTLLGRGDGVVKEPESGVRRHWPCHFLASVSLRFNRCFLHTSRVWAMFTRVVSFSSVLYAVNVPSGT